MTGDVAGASGVGLQRGRRGRRRASLTVLAALLVVALVGLPTAAAQAVSTPPPDPAFVDQHSSNCSATAAGTADQPFCTIGEAVATGTGHVLVATGIYQEEVKPNSEQMILAAQGANVVVTGGPPGAPAQPAFYVSNRHAVWISGFTITTGDVGILVYGSNDISIGDNHVTGSPRPGVELLKSQATVQGNRIDDNATGVYVSGNASNGYASFIDGNELADNSDRGISLYQSDANQLDYNVIRGSAQPIYALNSTDTRITSNVIYGTTPGASGGASGYAIDVHGGDSAPQAPTTGTEILYNSIAQYQPAPAVNVEQSSKTTLVDNVIDVLGAPAPAVRINPSSLPGSSADYDVLHGLGGTLVSWNGTSYASLAKLTAATGQETHGIQAPSGFADPANGNLTLAAGSPAIDSAFYGMLTTPAGTIPVEVNKEWNEPSFDVPLTPNTGVGTDNYSFLSYADRGAYERQNPGFEANTTGWNTSGSSAGVTLTRATGGHTGSGAALLTNTGSTPATCNLNSSPDPVWITSAGTYTATLWVRADAPGATLTLKLLEWRHIASAFGAKVAVTKSTVKLTTQWQPVTVQYTAAEPFGENIYMPEPGNPGYIYTNGSQLGLNATVTNASPGTCFYADDASIYAR